MPRNRKKCVWGQITVCCTNVAGLCICKIDDETVRDLLCVIMGDMHQSVARSSCLFDSWDSRPLQNGKGSRWITLRCLTVSASAYSRSSKALFVCRQEAPLGNDGEMLSLDPPTLKQSIAWEFASMAIRRQELKHAEQLLGRGGRRVKDVEVLCNRKTGKIVHETASICYIFSGMLQFRQSFSEFSQEMFTNLSAPKLIE